MLQSGEVRDGGEADENESRGRDCIIIKVDPEPYSRLVDWTGL